MHSARAEFGGMRPEDIKRAELDEQDIRAREILKEWEEIDGMNEDLLAVYKSDLEKVVGGDKSVIAKIAASGVQYPIEFGTILKRIDELGDELKPPAA